MSHRSGSVTRAIAALDGPGESAAQLLWERFFQQLCDFAARRIYRRHRRLLSPDEIATDAFLALIDGIRQKRFDRVRDRDDLWQMLILIAARRTIHVQRQLDRKKRGGGKVRGQSALGRANIDSIIDFIGRDLSPEVFAQIQEMSQQLFAELPNDALRHVAAWRMAGHSNAEIATKLDVTERTVERKLKLIRDIWMKMASR